MIVSGNVFAIIFYFACPTAAEEASDMIHWHASHYSLNLLYELQNEQFAVARAYLESETNRIRDLERQIELNSKNTLLSTSERSASNLSAKNSYLHNHINGLQLIKRIHNNILEIKYLSNNEKSLEVFKNFDENKSINELNMLSMYRSLRRLQRYYEIPAYEMAAGRRKDRDIGDPMDACECYAMVEYSFKKYDMFGAIEWAIQAYDKWLIDQLTCVDVDTLLYYIKSASTITGFNYKSLPNFEEQRQPDNCNKFDQYMSLMSNELFLRDVSTQSDIYETYNLFENDEKNQIYRRLCATGKSERPLTNNSKCRYQTKNSTYRILMPFKEEDISDNPYLKVYHDAIFDEEINFILGLDKKDLMNANFYTRGKSILVEEKRLGQLKWLSEPMNPELFSKLNDRIECLTGYSIESAEKYQLVNYGVAGHFTLHVDAFSDGPKYNGNRFITVLFYLTDVPDDGYTVFPNIKYAAHCRKGSAVVWHNLYLNNGTVHSGTTHGGCPIIKGNKWILTKALFEDKQPLRYNWRANTEVIIV